MTGRASRTGGISIGNGTHTRPPAPHDPNKPETSSGDMVKDLEEMQRRTGYWDDVSFDRKSPRW